MEQITVKELATEFELKNSVVISELKKIGVWVPSSDTPVDHDIANRIRKRLQLMADAALEEKEKKAEKAKKATSKTRRSIKELGKPRKRAARKKPVQEAKEEQPFSPLSGSMRPRKGKKATYRKVDQVTEEELPEKTEITIEDEPVLEPVEAHLPVAPVPVEPEIPVEDAIPPPSEPGKEVPVPEPVEVSAPLDSEALLEELAPPSEPEEAEAVPVEATPEVEEARVDEPAVSVELPEEVAAPAVKEEQETAAPAKTKRSVAKKRKKKKRDRAQAAKTRISPETAGGPRVITFTERVTVKFLAEKIGIRSSEVIGALMQIGVMANMNQLLDQETVVKLCEQFEVTPSFVTFEEATARAEKITELPEDLVQRAPVVTVMGHVDHGKTTLLDFIRKARVAEGEAGGITQHIGAYDVRVGNQKIVFIDTPGHEAFTRMRARGAQATDIVVLVVAADDGVMPQTIEAINHARAAEVPIIVAINKIDKPGADSKRVKQGLNEHNLLAEDWGGDTVMVEVSAIEGTNVDQLLEMILLVSDLLELSANPQRAASGVILEAKMEKGRGAVATLLVQNGSLSVGENFIAGSAYGKIRAMFSEKGLPVNKVGPSSAVEILGLQGIPLAGDVFQVVEDAGKAREMVEFRHEKQREQELAKSARASLEDLYAQLKAGSAKELPIVLKADTQGSVEVLEDTLEKLSGDKVKIELIHRSVGAITESDVLLATASNAIVIGFNVRPEANAKTAAEHEGIEIRTYSVIYEVAEDIEKAMLGLLEPTIRERYLGRAEVRETFRVPKVGTVAGSYIQDGSISRHAEARLLRDNVVIYEGKLGSLKRFKDDVSEVKTGYECGISIANFNDLKIGDVIEAYIKEEVAPQLN